MSFSTSGKTFELNTGSLPQFGFTSEPVLRYVLLGAIAVVLISIVLVLRGGPTGYAVYYEGPVEGQTTLMLQIADSDNLGDSYTISGTPNINAGSNEELI